jgi:hypothetical protein
VRGLPPDAAARVEKQDLMTLIRRLATATAARSADWQMRAADVYSWSSVEGSINVGSRDGDGAPPYQLVVYNGRGEAVDELTSELLRNDQPAPWNDDLRELYRSARRNALRADDVIEALIGALPTGQEAPAADAQEL